MKKLLLGLVVLGGGAYLLTKEKVVASGKYENKGQTAAWKIVDKKGVLVAYIKMPGADWNEIASQGTAEGLGQLIDQQLRQQGYLPQ